MHEIIVPELLAGFFIAVSLIRFFIKKLWNLEGLIWLPVLALGIIIALFPAYGFRPECVPLLVYGFFRALFNLPALISLLNHSRDDDFQGQNPVRRALMLFLLVPALGIALFFAPAPDSDLPEAGVVSAAITDEARGEELFLRIYGGYAGGKAGGAYGQAGTQALKPLLILIPPAAGSVTVIDRVCGELRDAGFTVAAYSRRGFDSPAVGPDGKKYYLSPGGRKRLFRAENQGGTTAAANAIGRSLEEGRRQDIVFLLNLLRQNRPLFSGTDPAAVFLAGYNEGGAALLELSGAPDFAARYPAVKGVIAVESPLLSALTREDAPAALPSGGNWFSAVWSGIRGRAAALRPRKITGIGEVPRPNVPVCFIVSDKAADPRYRETRYATIFKALLHARVPAVLVAAAGAGPLDYSDIPEKYPIYPVLRPGGRALPPGSLARGIHGPGETAALMTNFAAAVLAPGPETEERTVPPLSRKALSPQNFHIETNSNWNSLKKGSIL
jgi:hypothetical protein